MNTKLSVIEAKPNRELIEQLEDVLERARTGEIQGVAYVISYQANLVGSGWAGIAGNRMRIMGELYQVLHHLAALEVR